MPVKQKIIIEPFTIVCWHYLPRSGRDAGRATPGENRSIPVKPFTVGLLHSSARHCEPRSGVAIQTNNIPSMASKLCKANKHRFLSLFCDLAKGSISSKYLLPRLLHFVRNDGYDAYILMQSSPLAKGSAALFVSKSFLNTKVPWRWSLIL